VIILDPADPKHLFAGGGDFYRPETSGDLWESIDGGKNWNLTGLRKKVVNALLINPKNPKIMYAGCGNSTSAEVPLYKSTDGGKNWQASFAVIPGKLPSFAVIPIKTPSLLHYDGDTRPVMRERGISNRAVTDLAFHRKDKDVIYASTYGAGVYISPDQAKNWLNLGTPEHNVHAISISSFLCATGTQGGMWSSGGHIIGYVRDVVPPHNGIHPAEISNYLIFPTTTINKNGFYCIISAPSGIFTLTATAHDYEMVTKPPVTVTVNGPLTIADVLYMRKKIISN